MKLRPEVKWFAEQMELKLRENDDKPGWHDDLYPDLYRRLEEELQEVRDASMKTGWWDDRHKIIGELADVANFAMMLADNLENKRNKPAPRVFYPTHGERGNF